MPNNNKNKPKSCAPKPNENPTRNVRHNSRPKPTNSTANGAITAPYAWPPTPSLVLSPAEPGARRELPPAH